ncbi:MAG: MarC family NAAT transporter [Candidatus Melainabacteria bacterium]|nr:MarC family NAAT transporter [Candidatus Melainabacteria bacterium]MBI3308681.1 MarC family NAAT transporter [Candidatus Melainabacteria bacterium]
MGNEFLLFFVGSFVSLFSIVDPLLAVPVFVSLTEKYTPQKRIAIAKQASIYALGIMLLFFIAGGVILTFFGISLEGLRIAGGLMIIGSAIEMLQKKEKLLPKEQTESEEKDDIAFSPLAMPLLSGPGSIAVIIGMTTDAKSWLHYPVILLTIILVAILCYAFLRLAPFISQKMSATTISSFNRIMGFILLCIGVQYIVNGVMPLLKAVFNCS